MNILVRDQGRFQEGKQWRQGGLLGTNRRSPDVVGESGKMPNYYISLGSDQAAMAFYNYLKNKGFSVQNEELAKKGSLVVFNTSKRAIETMAKEGKVAGQLHPPYHIRVNELRTGSFIMRS